MVYVVHPLELPTNKQAAQAYYDANSHVVDSNAPMAQTRQNQATATIQAHQDYVSTRIPEVTPDPRLEPPPGPPDTGEPTVTAIEPDTGPENKVTSIVVIGTGFSNAQQVYIGNQSCHNTLVISDIQINTDTDGGTNAGVYPLTVHMHDQTIVTGPDFTYTPVTPEEIPEEV